MGGGWQGPFEGDALATMEDDDGHFVTGFLVQQLATEPFDPGEGGVACSPYPPKRGG